MISTDCRNLVIAYRPVAFNRAADALMRLRRSDSWFTLRDGRSIKGFLSRPD